MAATRVGAPRHHCVRFNLCSEKGRGIELSRLDFSRRYVRGFLGFAPGDINCLLVLPHGKGFDVSFKSVEMLRVFWEKFEGGKDKFGLFNVERLTGVFCFCENV